MLWKSLALLAVVLSATADVYFKESFESGWEDRFTEGVPQGKTMGPWKHTAGKWFDDPNDKGLQTGEDYRFFSISAPLDADVYNKGKDLVIQYTVKNEQNLDCGGAYIKLMPEGIDQETFGGDTDYKIMFGPDICGTATRRTHAIFNYKGENHLVKKDIRCETDRLSHVYTMIVHPDNTYEIMIDLKKVESGNMEEDWSFLPPKMIRDPEASKPADWVDEEEIPDPESVKPAGWDDVPAKIPDPEAAMPDDWDEEEDGEWDAPMIANPEYQGEWAPKMIPNPDYRGPWVHPMVDNPEYTPDDEIYAVCNPCSFVGFELWQVKSGTIFDDILVTDSVEEAMEFAKATWEAKKDGEKDMFDAEEAEKKAKEEEERKLREAEMKAKSEEAGEEDEEEYEEYEVEDGSGDDEL